MENNNLIKLQSGLVKQVGNVISITNKLLAKSDFPLLIPYRKKNKWGFCTPDKQIVIDCKYDNAFRFTEGLARVKKDKKWGFIDIYGNEKTDFSFDDVYAFSEGLAAVYVHHEGWGYIDQNGKSIISCHGYEVYDFTDDLALVCSGNKCGFIDKNGLIKFPVIYDYEPLENQFIDHFEFIRCPHMFSNGFAQLYKDGKGGILNRNGEVIVPFNYDHISNFSNDLAKVGNVSNSDGEILYGFVDRRGDLVIDLKYQQKNGNPRGGFSEGLALVAIINKNSHYTTRFFINKQDEIIIPASNSYDFIGRFSEGMAAIKRDNKYGFIDKNGDVVIDCIFDKYSQFSEGLACIQLNGESGFIDKSGKIVINFNLPVHGAHIFGMKFNNGIVPIWLNDRLGYINRSGIQFWED